MLSELVKNMPKNQDLNSAMLELVLPFLRHKGIVSNSCTADKIRGFDLKELAILWNVPLKDPKTQATLTLCELLKAVASVAERIIHRKDAASQGRQKVKLQFGDDDDASQEDSVVEEKEEDPNAHFSDPYAHIKIKISDQFFGLPNHAYDRTSLALVYQGRSKTGSKSALEHQHHDHNDHTLDGQSEQETDLRKTKLQQTKSSNYISQRKVIHALLKMSENAKMRFHFVNKGGIEAVYKLCEESEDIEVLRVCAQCMVNATSDEKFCSVLIDKDIINVLLQLMEGGNEEVRWECARVVMSMTMQKDIEEKLVDRGILVSIQNLMTSQNDSIVSIAAICACNTAPAFSALSDLEIVVRLCMHVAKRLDVINNFHAAFFVSSLFNNLSRISSYTGLLCEEGLLPLLLAMLASRNESEITERCTESFVNLSMNRKNQREISSSGIVSHFSKILAGDEVSSLTRSYALLMVGNLLSAGYLHDKIAREDTLTTIINMLFPNLPKQFAAVAYCLSQIVQTASSAKVAVNCGLVKKACSLLNSANWDAELLYENPQLVEADPATQQAAGIVGAAGTAILTDGVSYLWTILLNLSLIPDIVELIVAERSVFQQIFKETQKPILITSNGAILPGQLQLEILQLIVNLSSQRNLEELLIPEDVILLTQSAKTIYVKSDSSLVTVKSDALTAMINLAFNIKYVRKVILGDDLIRVFEDAGTKLADMNKKYIMLVSQISLEESCCSRLIDQGAQRLIVTIQNTMDDLGKDLSAATLHNMSLKRASLGAGMLSTLMALLRANKSIRALWVVKCMAHLTVNAKARAVIAKERKVIPLLSMMMRSGGAEADKVQRFCAISVCNILCSHMDRGIVEELIKNTTITDLVVVTLLRVNSGSTKEYLGKALFNFMSIGEYREKMVDLDVMDAVCELGKIELVQLLELSVKTIFNFTCEVAVPKYAAKLGMLNVPSLLIGRIAAAKHVLGAKAPNSVRLMCGQAIANISFNENLATSLLFDKLLAEAMQRLFELHTDESTYCVCVTFFNVSFLPQSVSLADSSAVVVLVEVLSRGPILCTQMAVAALCNMSLHEVFYEQLTKTAIEPMMKVMSAPQIAMPIKLDALHFLYNIVTVYQPARAIAIDSNCVPALWKILKAQNDSDCLACIGRISMDVCSEAVSHHKKLLSDGIMPILLKLSKLEMPKLKLDISRAMFSLTTISLPDVTMKILKWDSIDILFWLTLQDSLNLYDPIRKNCARALRNFTINKDEALLLAEEDRFITILKVFLKSTNEDVLYQTAGVLYNLLSFEECKKTMLKRGVVPLIFEVAATGYANCRHICSACLHMIPDDMPDMEDPAVLVLVMSLLDADGDLFGDLGVRSQDQLPYEADNCPTGTAFTYEGTDFSGHWVTLLCDMENLFHPATVPVSVQASKKIPTRPMAAATMDFAPHTRFSTGDFNEFEGMKSNVGACAVDSSNESPALLEGGGSLFGFSNEFENEFQRDGESDMSKARDRSDENSDGDAKRMSNRGRQRGESAVDFSLTTPELTAYAPGTANKLDIRSRAPSEAVALISSRSGGDSSNQIIPISSSQIVFPKIQDRRNETPHDTLSAIKKHPYKGSSQNKVIRLGEAKRMQESFYSK